MTRTDAIRARLAELPLMLLGEVDGQLLIITGAGATANRITLDRGVFACRASAWEALAHVAEDLAWLLPLAEAALALVRADNTITADVETVRAACAAARELEDAAAAADPAIAELVAAARARRAALARDHEAACAAALQQAV